MNSETIVMRRFIFSMTTHSSFVSNLDHSILMKINLMADKMHIRLKFLSHLTNIHAYFM